MERGDLGRGEHRRAAVAVLRVPERDAAVRQRRHLDALTVRATALALPPGAELVGVREAGEGGAVGVLGVEHARLPVLLGHSAEHLL